MTMQGKFDNLEGDWHFCEDCFITVVVAGDYALFGTDYDLDRGLAGGLGDVAFCGSLVLRGLRVWLGLLDLRS